MDQGLGEIRHETVVPVNIDRAFHLFADRIGEWWPVENTFARVEGIAASLVDITIDSEPGGRWFERLADGRTLSWGLVIAYDRPNHLMLSWQIAADGRPEADPQRASTVEVSFTERSAGTAVSIIHRDFDRHGPEAGKIWHQAMDSDEGWPKFLDRYRAFVVNA
jgi:uncharacterized protein YndB with AHSA1/START domain